MQRAKLGLGRQRKGEEEEESKQGRRVTRGRRAPEGKGSERKFPSIG